MANDAVSNARRDVPRTRYPRPRRIRIPRTLLFLGALFGIPLCMIALAEPPRAHAGPGVTEGYIVVGFILVALLVGGIWSTIDQVKEDKVVSAQRKASLREPPREVWTRKLSEARMHGDKLAELRAIGNVAFWLTFDDRYDEAQPYATEALALARALGNQPFEEERALYELGCIAFGQGEPERAEELCRESVEVANTLPEDKRGELADRLWQVGEFLCEHRGKREEGCQMLARAEAIYVELQPTLRRTISKAWAEGRIEHLRDLRRTYGDWSA